MSRRTLDGYVSFVCDECYKVRGAHVEEIPDGWVADHHGGHMCGECCAASSDAEDES